MTAVALDGTERWFTAVHEAGHAIGYRAHGLGFRYITLRPRGPGTLGMVRTRPRRVDARALAVITAAGPAAEAVARILHEDGGVLPDEDTFGGAALILAGSLDGHAELAGAHAPFQPVEQSIERALDLLAERWDEVGKVASALAESTRAMPYSSFLALLTAE